MEKKTSSEVWNFFSKDAKNSKLSLCRLCGKRYKNGGGTSNLRNHILRKHQNLQLSHLEKRQNLSESLSAGVESNTDSDLETSESDSLSSNKSDNQNDDSQSSVSMDSCNTFYRQATLNEMFRNQASFEVGGSNDVKITEALVYMICKDNLPFHSTKKKGMRFFFKSILPRYQIPSRKTITRRIEDKYAALNIVVRKNLSRVNTIAFTTDIATVMNATRSFLVYTVHYIDKEACAIKSISLGVKDLTPHHTAEHISKDFEAILESWDLSKNKIISVTTDNGANIVAGVNLLLASKNKHVSCLAHNINFVVTKALGSEAVKDFVTIIMKVKTIVAYFKHSITAQDDLRAEQRKEGITDGTFIYLKQEVPTRWNSTFIVLNDFSNCHLMLLKYFLHRFIKKDHLCLNQLNWV
ncbi:hypothetical protein ABEB36_014133 [Hypothenemus hampei]|uniref:BED-type domain-containing protein n=1 Tax=Hypothenemus hampei TaxID=57062 RepID=A0ABD1E3Q3_HYPHA